MKLSKKSLVAALFAGSTLLATGSANAWFGGWAPWNWFDDDDWYDYPPPWVYYGAYPYAPYGYAPYAYGYPYGYGPYPYPYPYAQPNTTAPATKAPNQNSK